MLVKMDIKQAYRNIPVYPEDRILLGINWQQQYGQSSGQERVLIQCDNAAVVAIINSGSSKDAEVMHLVRCLAFVAAKFNFVVVSSHIKGTDDDVANALSYRDRDNYFLSHYLQAQPHPSLITTELLDLIVVEKPGPPGVGPVG